MDSETDIIPSENKNKILNKCDKYSGFKYCPMITKNYASLLVAFYDNVL